MLSAGDTPSLTHYLFCTHVCSPPKIVFILSQISDFVNPENFSDSQCGKLLRQSMQSATLSKLFAAYFFTSSLAAVIAYPRNRQIMPTSLKESPMTEGRHFSFI